MLHHIRPYRFFFSLESEGLDRVAHVRLSKRRGLAMATDDPNVHPELADFSLTYLETMVLITALKITDAHRVFEFGTHLGATALNLALNLPPDGLLCTIDLMPSSRFKEYRGFDVERRIVTIAGKNSSTLNVSEFRQFDLIWVDGNPDRSDDTRNAFTMLNDQKLSCIGWHDYGSADANTTETVEKLAQTITIYHIEETKTCLYFNRKVNL